MTTVTIFPSSLLSLALACFCKYHNGSPTASSSFTLRVLGEVSARNDGRVPLVSLWTKPERGKSCPTSEYQWTEPGIQGTDTSPGLGSPSPTPTLQHFLLTSLPTALQGPERLTSFSKTGSLAGLGQAREGAAWTHNSAKSPGSCSQLVSH